MDKLRTEAAARGLSGCVEILSREHLPHPLPPTAGLAAPPTSDPISAIDQFRRRGLDPRLVPIFLEWLKHRPIEKGLFAWDVLCNSLLPADDELTLRRLRTAAQAVKDVLPKAGGAWADTRSISAAQLVERVALPEHLSLSSEDRTHATRFNALGAIEANQVMSREHGRPVITQLLESAHQFARYLHLAHASTLATFYLDYLVRRCGYHAALPDWIDAMTDSGGDIILSREKLIADGTQDEIELLNFALGRSLIRRNASEALNDQIRSGPTPLDYKTPSGKEAALRNAHSTLLVAHSFLADDETPVPFELVNEIVVKNPAWRYAGRVRIALLAHITPKNTDLPLRVFDQFLATFGNDADTWNDFDTFSKPGSEWLEGMYARSTREVAALPHDVGAWRALGVNLGYEEQQQWNAIVAARVAEQCKLD